MNITFENESTSNNFKAGVVVGLAGAAAILYATKKLDKWMYGSKDTNNTK